MRAAGAQKRASSLRATFTSGSGSVAVSGMASAAWRPNLSGKAMLARSARWRLGLTAFTTPKLRGFHGARQAPLAGMWRVWATNALCLAGGS